MRTLLLLALFLYDVVSNATRQNNYDYTDSDVTKRHSFTDERRNWRKKALLKSLDHENPKYSDDSDAKLFGVIDRQRELDGLPATYNSRRHYEDGDRTSVLSRVRSAEVGHNSQFTDKEDERKSHFTMSCGRQHERYEPCFAGCAAVTCDNPRERLRPCYPFCEAGCICVHPYVRDDRTHKCVAPEECTKGLKGIPDLGDDT